MKTKVEPKGQGVQILSMTREPVCLDEGRSGEFQNLRKCLRLHFLCL